MGADASKKCVQVWCQWVQFRIRTQSNVAIAAIAATIGLIYNHLPRGRIAAGGTEG